jgi:hypothetical protein
MPTLEEVTYETGRSALADQELLVRRAGARGRSPSVRSRSPETTEDASVAWGGG